MSQTSPNETLCPACGHDTAGKLICPECGYEVHTYLHQLGALTEAYEQARLDAARERIQAIDTAASGVKPVGFLVSDRLTVHCIYPGENTFGSAKAAPERPHQQRVIVPECRLRPMHFAIDAIKGERRYEFVLREVDGAESVFVNSTAEPAGLSHQLVDDDNVVIYTPEGQAKLKFRINLEK